MATPEPGETKRFLLEVWLEPRALVADRWRIRGRIRDLATGATRAVASLATVDAFVRDALGSSEQQVGWEVEG